MLCIGSGVGSMFVMLSMGAGVGSSGGGSAYRVVLVSVCAAGVGSGISGSCNEGMGSSI